MSDTQRVRLRDTLAAVPAYKAGKPAAPREDLVTYKISSNENPYPPLPSVLDAVRETAGRMNRYPDMAVRELSEKLAERWGVTPDEIATGTGSVGILGTLVQITCDPGDEMVFAWRSFEAYPIVAALAGAKAVQVPLDSQARHDLDAMAAAITDRTRLVIVCTPNNPTGPSATEKELREFIAKVPTDVLVVIDEAYLEFVEPGHQIDAMAIFRDHPNVAVLRTFSKAYGLAGLRVGYCVAHEPVAEALRKAAVPFGVSTIAQDAAIASLDAYDELQERVDALMTERERVLQVLTEQGWKVPDSQANFVWLPLGDDAMAFAAAADQAGLVVRPFDGDGVRCSIGETEANDRLIEVCEAFLAR
ncbi:histidinol-phosphate transaminase [Yimella sp. cx-51]|uniref:histidinol-phosphate transaminase n=1 Tax=Yimella sp. cx-51 TaxID=2770551 RepID=UPI00165EB049|nr:histidinol-phosphate transaminase [Yimella sp. cx-51]MBC9956623.1 histidinol-phosphate transaminase [Yimella sp. cx-51]QTH38279.1 histidinol-phosphate transaminase [Yimella sp. cx-51]